jgi:hydrogenase maturation protease
LIVNEEVGGPVPAFPLLEDDGQVVTPLQRQTARVLVGGIGLPWLRDLDFGTQFIRRVESLDWPDDVVVEDLSYAAHRVLHRLQELRPEKVVLVGAMPRDVDPPGAIRRYALDLTPPEEEEVHDRLGEAVGGIIDLDHTLAVVRYWKGFPADTVVIEVEPGDRAFGLGFSAEVESTVEPILAMVREEVGISSEEASR